MVRLLRHYTVYLWRWYLMCVWARRSVLHRMHRIIVQATMTEVDRLSVNMGMTVVRNLHISSMPCAPAARSQRHLHLPLRIFDLQVFLFSFLRVVSSVSPHDD